MIISVFGLLILGVWANFDAKEGRIGTLWLLLPCVIATLINWLFLPLFGVFALVYVGINKFIHYKFGFADAMAMPFALSILNLPGFVLTGLPGFAVFLGVQTLFYDHLPRLLVGRRDKNGNIRYVPLIFNAFLVGVVVTLV